MSALSGLSRTLTKRHSDLILSQDVREPEVEYERSDFAFVLSGWTVGRFAPAVRIELLNHGFVVRSTGLDRHRSKVAGRFPQTPWAASSGWRMLVDSRALDPSFDCELRAVLEDGSVAPLAIIRGHRQPLPTVESTFLQPLLLSSVGRSGSTWLMRLFSEHPEIVVTGGYPYEMRPALYWLQMFRVLTGLLDRSKIKVYMGKFYEEEHAVGPNPFFGSWAAESPRLHKWADNTYVHNLAKFCQSSIEQWYRSIALDQGLSDATFFAEKYQYFLNHSHSTLWREMYPQIREIFLVRDFRDVASSALAFNAQRGFDDFGRQRVNTDEEYLHELRGMADSLLDRWNRHRSWAHLVHYEDLVRNPFETLGLIFDYLGVDSSRNTLESLLGRASLDNVKMQHHKTTRSPEQSIGRWRFDLSPPMREVATHLFDDLHDAFGYRTTPE